MEENGKVMPSDGAGKGKKIWSVVSNILLFAFLAVAVITLVMSIFAKKNANSNEENPPLTVFGHQIRYVQTASMEADPNTDVSGYKIKSLPVGTAVFVEKLPDDPEKRLEWYGKLAVGDVLTFRYYTGGTQMTITHRIIEITPRINGEGYTIVLRGDNQGDTSESKNVALGKQTIQTWVDDPDSTSFNYVIGKVVGSSRAIGFVVRMLTKPLGIVLILIVPAVIIIIMEVIRIVNLSGTERREKDAEEKAQQRSEIDELKRQLAALQMQAGAPPTAPPAEEPGQSADESASGTDDAHNNQE